MKSNKFCEKKLLTNEAAVENLFVNRFLSELGYKDNQIKYKTSIDGTERISIGSKKVNYKPDYIIFFNKKPRIVIDAKSPTVNISDYVQQAAGYCLMLNQKYLSENPVDYFLLTNGLKTQLYAWDSKDPILELSFDDVNDGNVNFTQLKTLLVPSKFNGTVNTYSEGSTHRLEKAQVEGINNDFAWCHQHIYKKGNISQAAGFEEFVKVIFIKLLSDRRIMHKYPQLINKSVFHVPSADVRFSTKWIYDREDDAPSPLDTIQFRELIDNIENEIQAGKRKRIFKLNDRINLNPEIIKGVVSRLENVYLFGIDADLNGRLFETFLNATMRGKDLGQFFTPRSIVKLGTKLGNIRVSKEHVDIVIDACCGTGGFLIDALADMWSKVDSNTSLTKKENAELKHQIAWSHIYGVDVGREPNMARLTRMNMYLHGDGGSSIFEADILDKKLTIHSNDVPEINADKKQLRRLLSEGNFADVVLTNPPFAKTYDRNSPSEAKVLEEYTMAFSNNKDVHAPRKSLRSSLMFMERYYDLLKAGGRLITVIDDGTLSGKDYSWFRNYLRQKFIIRGVISLPGDAFQRSQARVKTSLLIMEKKSIPDEVDQQGNVFMYPCIFIGLDDPSRQRTLPVDRLNRMKANEEIGNVEKAYMGFLSGDSAYAKYSVNPQQIADRMDVKFCLEKPGRNVKLWKKRGLEVVTISDLLEPVELVSDDIILTKNSNESVTYLLVTYDGFAKAGDEIVASDCKYSELYRVHTNQIVISHISATYGAAAVIPQALDGCVVAKEFSILRPKAGVNSQAAWLLLRSPEIRADLLLSAAGANRTRVKWETMKDIKLPLPNRKIMDEVFDVISKAEELEKQAIESRKEIVNKFEDLLGLASDDAYRILEAFKPPK